MNEKQKVDVHIFSPGTQTSAQGVTREFTKGDLKQVVDSYKPGVHEAPILIGHEMSDKVPSWGWVKTLKMKGDDLFAEVEFAPQMQEFVRDGLYKKVSASFYSPESKINPDPGKWSLRHVAMLGGQPPAVKGLKGFAYSEESEGEGVLDFAVEMTLTPDQVFDEELGPTLQVDQSPLEMLKEKLEEARQEMLEEQKREADTNAALEQTDEEVTEAPREDSDFAEKKDMKKKAPAGKQGAEDAEEEVSEEEEDSMDNKEKKMDPVGKEDKDVDNDGDSDSSDEYLKKRRDAIKKAMKDDKSDNAEDSVDHGSGCGSPREYMEKYDEKKHGEMKKYMEKYEGDHGELKKYVESDYKGCADHAEVTIPEGVDEAQYVAGFKDAVDKYMTGVEAGADEVVHEEAEDQTADYMKGIEDGFEYAQTTLGNISKDGLGSAKHDEKCCDTDEESEGEGPEASKVKKSKNDGANEVKDSGEFEEPTFDPSNKSGSTKKRGTDNLNSSDVGVKETAPYAEDEDEAAHGEDKAFGVDKVGKPGEAGKTGRSGKGKASDDDRDEKGSDGGAYEKDKL